MTRRPPGRDSKPVARIRALKVGVTSGSDFLYQAWFTAPSMVGVGRSASATIQLDHPKVPDHIELVSVEEESCLLQFNRSIDLAFFYDGLFRRPNYLIDEGLAFRRGRNYYLNLQAKARGTITLGPFRLLFKVDDIETAGMRAIALPSAARPTPHCGACGQPLEMGLPRAGVVARCDVCRKFSRFAEGVVDGPTVDAETQSGPAQKPAEEPRPVRRRRPPKGPPTEDPPILLDRPISGHDGIAQSALENQSTVLDAGVIQQAEGSFGDLALPLEASGPVFPGAPADFEERDTGQFSRNRLLHSGSEADEVRVAAGEHPRSTGEHPSTTSSAAISHSQLPLTSMPVDVSNGNVVPMPMSPSARRRVSAALSSAPHPAVRDARGTAQATDTYAAARLADRLTLLIFALILIALLLACILGVLLVQGPLRSLGAQFTSTAAQSALQVGSSDDPFA
jgi:hypothetical protein